MKQLIRIADIIERAKQAKQPIRLFFHTMSNTPLEEGLVLVRYDRPKEDK